MMSFDSFLKILFYPRAAYSARVVTPFRVLCSQLHLYQHYFFKSDFDCSQGLFFSTESLQNLISVRLTVMSVHSCKQIPSYYIISTFPKFAPRAEINSFSILLLFSSLIIWRHLFFLPINTIYLYIN